MKNSFRNGAYILFAVILTVCAFSDLIRTGPLHAGLWDEYFLSRLIGEGKYVGYQRNAETKDPLFPIEVISDGFKMIRVYQSGPDIRMVEWTWRVILKNKSSRPVEITFEYKLQDEDALLVVSSKEYFRKIDPGETITIEKTEKHPYDTVKRVMNSNWYIHLIK
jgi:hypothetical protein